MKIAYIIPNLGKVSIEWALSLASLVHHTKAQQYFYVSKHFRLDSVPDWTPVIVRYPTRKRADYLIDIKEIKEVANEDWKSNGFEEIASSPYEVLTDRGFTKIKAVIRHPYNGNLIKFICTGGNVVVSPNHSIYKLGYWTDARKIKVGDILSLGINNRQFIIGDERKEYFEGTEELAWFYGFFTAEGYAPKDGSNITITNTNEKLLEKCEKILEDYYNLKDIEWKLNSKAGSSRIFYGRKVTLSKDAWQIIAPKKRLAQVFRERFYTTSGFKKVPISILNAPNKIIEKYLEGYIAGDGHIKPDEGTKDITTYSPSAALGIIILLLKLGHSYSVQTKKGILRNNKISINKDTQSVKLKARGIVNRIENFPYKGYLYDLETGSGKFLGGVGPFLLHNTARTEAVIKAYEAEPDYFMFIDSDILPHIEKEGELYPFPDAINYMLRYKYPIVSGYYYTSKLVPNTFERKTEKIYEPIEIEKEKETAFVDAVGLGFCLIDRKIFDLMIEKDLVPFFDYEIEYKRKDEKFIISEISEDISFFRKLNDLGFRALVLRKLFCKHEQNAVISFDKSIEFHGFR